MSSAPRGLAPREGLELGLMKMGRTGPLVSHAAGRRQASLGTPVPISRQEALQRASIMEEHRTLMGAVVEKVQSAKSGLNEAFTSPLTGFKVGDVIFLAAFHIKNMPVYR